jgi:hypothetical protein
MDLSFFRRAEARLAGCTPARLDFDLLVAALRVQREAGWDSAAEAPGPAASEMPDPIAEILLAGPAWREAVTAQGGCFNPAFARQGAVN